MLTRAQAPIRNRYTSYSVLCRHGHVLQLSIQERQQKQQYTTLVYTIPMGTKNTHYTKETSHASSLLRVVHERIPEDSRCSAFGCTQPAYNIPDVHVSISLTNVAHGQQIYLHNSKQTSLYFMHTKLPYSLLIHVHGLARYGTSAAHTTKCRCKAIAYPHPC